MKTNTVVIFLCLAFVANASWLSHIVNNTKLRGKVSINNDSGVKFDYKGNLGYENGKLALDLANVEAKFHADRKNSSKVASGNDFSRSYDYNGALIVSQNAHQAHVSIDGTANISGIYNKDGTGINYTFNSTNLNYWNASMDQIYVNGSKDLHLHVEGSYQQNGGDIQTINKIGGVSNIDASIYYNGAHVNTGSLQNGGKVEINQKVFLSNDIPMAKGAPNVTETGKINYEGFSMSEWSGQSVNYTAAEKAGFKGIGWRKSENNGDDSKFIGYVISENTDFTHKGQTFKNGQKFADYLTVGDLAISEQIGINTYQNGTWEHILGSAGTLNKWSIGEVVNKNETNSDDGKFLAEFKSNWIHNTNVVGQPIDQNSSDVRFGSATAYKYKGSDTLTKNPYKSEGFNVVHGDYQVSNGQPGNLSISIN